MIYKISDFAERSARPAPRSSGPPPGKTSVEHFAACMARRRGAEDAFDRMLLADALSAEDVEALFVRIREQWSDSGKVSS
jgi:hypothetical protein